MGESCDKCLLHDGLHEQFKRLEKEVHDNKEMYMPIAINAKSLMRDYPMTVRDINSKLDKVTQGQTIDKESLKAIHQRMDLNDEQRLEAKSTLETLHIELKNHMEDEERELKDRRKSTIALIMFLVGYLVSFAIYMNNLATRNDTRIQLITKDIGYIKQFVKEVKTND